MKNEKRIVTALLLLGTLASACSAFDAPEPRPKCEYGRQYEYCDEGNWWGTGGVVSGSGGAACSAFYQPDSSAFPRPSTAHERLYAWSAEAQLEAASTSDDFTLGRDEFSDRELAALDARGLGKVTAHFSSPLRVWWNGFANRLDTDAPELRDRLVEVRLRPDALVLHLDRNGFFLTGRDGESKPYDALDLDRVGLVVLDMTEGSDSCALPDETTRLPYRTMLVGNPEWIESWESGTTETQATQRSWRDLVSSFADTLDPNSNFVSPAFPAAVACLWSSGQSSPSAGCAGTENYLDGLARPTLDYAPSVVAMSELVRLLELPASDSTWSWSADAMGGAGGAGGATFD